MGACFGHVDFFVEGDELFAVFDGEAWKYLLVVFVQFEVDGGEEWAGVHPFHVGVGVGAGGAHLSINALFRYVYARGGVASFEKRLMEFHFFKGVLNFDKMIIG